MEELSRRCCLAADLSCRRYTGHAPGGVNIPQPIDPTVMTKGPPLYSQMARYQWKSRRPCGLTAAVSRSLAGRGTKSTNSGERSRLFQRRKKKLRRWRLCLALPTTRNRRTSAVLDIRVRRENDAQKLPRAGPFNLVLDPRHRSGLTTVSSRI